MKPFFSLFFFWKLTIHLNSEITSINTDTNTSISQTRNSSDIVSNSQTEQAPLIPNEEFGGFDLESYTFPKNFTCMNITNPSTSDECFNLNMINLDYNCCFVSSIVKGVSVNNSCIPMNSSNLPAFQFLIYNNTAEIESFYNCNSGFIQLSIIVITFINILIFSY